MNRSLDDKTKNQISGKLARRRAHSLSEIIRRVVRQGKHLHKIVSLVFI